MARPLSDVISLTVDRFVAAQLGNITGAVAESVLQFANSRTSKQLVAFLEAIAEGPGQAAAAEAHQKLANEMAKSVRASWAAQRGKLRPAVYDPPRPRKGKKGGRDEGGIEKIINAPYLAVGTPTGVEFGPIKLMDRDARHWARINYGAGDRGEGTHRAFSVRFSNLPALEYTIDEPARPGYGLPIGQFKGPDGRWQPRSYGGRDGAFYPRGKSQVFPTKGNAGFHMLDAGIARFFDLFPAVYGDLFREVLPSSARRGRPPRGLERVTVRGPGR